MTNSIRPAPRAIAGHCRGFTLIEVLTVIGIIGVLVGLTLPAVQAAREASRRAFCLNNLKGLVAATHGFETAQGGFPAGVLYHEFGPGRSDYSDHSVYVSLLPYMEQAALFNEINLSTQDSDTARHPHANDTSAMRSLEVLLCPSDPNTSPSPFGCTSYRANVGLGEVERVLQRPSGRVVYPRIDDGAFTMEAYTLPVGAFLDGLSNTLAFAEKTIGSPGTAYNPSRDWIEVSWTGNSVLTADDWVKVCSNLPDADHGRTGGGRNWIFYEKYYTTFFPTVPPNSPVPDCGSGLSVSSGVFAARSCHPGGVNAAMADGSARWFTSGISQNTWRALGTRAGGESVAAD